MTESSESARGEANRVKPARGRFDQTSIILHWLMVLLIAIQFSSAWLHETVDENSSIAAALLDTHRNSGVLIWILATARLIWRNNYAYLPPFPESMPKLQQAIAKANEYSLYAVLLVQPITGVGRVLLRGMPFDLFIWKVPALFEPDDAIRHLFVGAHELGANALLALIGLHAGAALFHYLFLRDGVLQRMLPWTSQLVRVPEADAPLAVNDVE
jgi:superoxide oxidase